MLVVIASLLTQTCVQAFRRGLTSLVPHARQSVALTRPSTSILATKPILVSLEGNIGAGRFLQNGTINITVTSVFVCTGKSTLLAHLKVKKPDWIFIDEPLNFWTSVVNDDGKVKVSPYDLTNTSVNNIST